MGDITSANTNLTLNIPLVFPQPQTLQGFAADDIFDVDALAAAETYMGVDGVLSAGFVYEQLKQAITLQADSASNAVFDAWYAYEKSTISKAPASAIFQFPALGFKFQIPKGYLKSYPVFASAKRVLQPRKYGIEWESISPPTPI